MAAAVLQEAIVVLFAGRQEPSTPSERRQLVRTLSQVPGAASTAYHAARDLFLMRYTPLVRSMAARMGNLDLVSDGLSALQDAIEIWRPQQGVRFISYAYPAIHRRMLTRLRSESRQRRVVEAARVLPHDTAASPEELVSEREEAELRDQALARAVRRLDAWQRRILELLYTEQRSIHEVADAMGTSHEAIRVTQQRALRLLRQRLGVR